MDELLELTIKRVDTLEKKLEKYFHILEVKNELDFVLRGSYIFLDELNLIMSGNYTLAGEDFEADAGDETNSDNETDTNDETSDEANSNNETNDELNSDSETNNEVNSDNEI